MLSHPTLCQVGCDGGGGGGDDDADDGDGGGCVDAAVFCFAALLCCLAQGLRYASVGSRASASLRGGRVRRRLMS